MTRVVLDTNVFVSALLQPAGPPAQVFLFALSGLVQLCMSGPVYAEYEEVIRRPRLGRSQEEIEAALQTIREKSTWIKPTAMIRACSDPDDDIFLECAAAARAHYLISGNLRHFPRKWGETQIVTAREFLDTAIEI
jgi:putative PIN family toxin of toxin-antitoxin system